MEKFPELLQLRQTIHELISEEDTDNNNQTVESRGAMIRSNAASGVCSAVEACMQNGLKHVSFKETVSLWGLLQWTNVAQQKRFQMWIQVQDKQDAVEQSQEWYNDMFKVSTKCFNTLLTCFKEELQNISSLTQDNQAENDITRVQALIYTIIMQYVLAAKKIYPRLHCPSRPRRSSMSFSIPKPPSDSTSFSRIRRRRF